MVRRFVHYRSRSSNDYYRHICVKITGKLLMKIHPEVKAIYERHHGIGTPTGSDRAFLEELSEHIYILERIIERDHGNHTAE